MFLAAISRVTPTELEICLVVPVSINISPLTGLESLKLIREAEFSGVPFDKGESSDSKRLHHLLPVTPRSLRALLKHAQTPNLPFQVLSLES